MSEHIRLCSVNDCGRKYFSKGYCRAHKARLDRNGQVFPEMPIAPPAAPGRKPCSEESCKNFARTLGMCTKHYTRVFNAGIRLSGAPDPCAVEGCDSPSRSKTLCATHYNRLRSTGTTELSPQVRMPRAELKRNPYGYLDLYLPDHPNATKCGKIGEHRYVMSEHLGRPLLPTENVHHKNGIRDDNRIENLELWSRAQPSGQRVSDKVAWALEFLRTYAPEALSGESVDVNAIPH